MFNAVKSSNIVLVLVVLLPGCSMFGSWFKAASEICAHETYVVESDRDVGSNSISFCDKDTGQCENLREAMNTANMCKSHGEKTIVLPQNSTYVINETNASSSHPEKEQLDSRFSGPAGLPIVYGRLVIEGNNSSIQRSSSRSTPNFRIFHVGADARLILKNVQISGGNAFIDEREASDTDFLNDSKSRFFGLGGGILNEGELELHGVKIEDSVAQSGGALYSEGPTIISNRSVISGNTGRLILGNRAEYSDGTIVAVRCLTSDSRDCKFPVKIRNSKFNYNRSYGDTLDIYRVESPQIEDSVFINNSGAKSVINIAKAKSAVIQRSSIVGNVIEIIRPGDHGYESIDPSRPRSILSLSDNVQIIGSTIYGNDGKGVSVLFCNGSYADPTTNIDLNDVTITENYAFDVHEVRPLPAVYVQSNCSISASNTVMARNSPSNCGGSAWELISRSVSDDDSCPGFVTLSDVGLVRGFDGDWMWYFLPSTNSGLIDFGERCSGRDQLGTRRPQARRGARRARCDVGAIERIFSSQP